MLSLIAPEAALQSFVLAFSSLFSIVNPVGSSLIFAQVAALNSHAERLELARRIGFYAALIMLADLWAGGADPQLLRRLPGGAAHRRGPRGGGLGLDAADGARGARGPQAGGGDARAPPGTSPRSRSFR